MKLFAVYGKVIRDDERYIVEDNTELDDLTVSKTILHPRQSTKGHSHADKGEVYMFVGGFGYLEIDDRRLRVKMGDIITIPKGAFHRVHNESMTHELSFVCVFPDGRDK